MKAEQSKEAVGEVGEDYAFRIVKSYRIFIGEWNSLYGVLRPIFLSFLIIFTKKNTALSNDRSGLRMGVEPNIFQLYLV